jgi:hypothetical protein
VSQVKFYLLFLLAALMSCAESQPTLTTPQANVLATTYLDKMFPPTIVEGVKTPSYTGPYCVPYYDRSSEQLCSYGQKKGEEILIGELLCRTQGCGAHSVLAPSTQHLGGSTMVSAQTGGIDLGDLLLYQAVMSAGHTSHTSYHSYRSSPDYTVHRDYTSGKSNTSWNSKPVRRAPSNNYYSTPSTNRSPPPRATTPSSSSRSSGYRSSGSSRSSGSRSSGYRSGSRR